MNVYTKRYHTRASPLPWAGFDVWYDEVHVAELLSQIYGKGKLDIKRARFLEAEMSIALNIPFDETWYKIDLGAREMMLATRIIRSLIDDVRVLEANARPK